MQSSRFTEVLRPQSAHPTVGPIELFFDLVYVFAIIQLSHFLLHDLSWSGALETMVLYLAVWWGWNYTAWAMNWLDPDHAAVRSLLALLMLAALFMAIAIPGAFDGDAGWFVGGYLFLQIVRSAFMVVAFRGQLMGRNYGQLLAWTVMAGVFWVAGAFLEDEGRLIVWGLAVALDYLGPLAGFALPGFGPTRMSDWPVAEEHIAERNRLVFIIALGESILILGFTLSEIELDAGVVTAAVVGFTTIVMLWWLYFSYRLGNAEHEIERDAEAARRARGAYAYAHALMVGGAIVVAVGIEQVTMHATDDATWAVAATVIGGPVLYLVGNIIYNLSRSGTLAWSRVVTIAAFAVLLPFATLLPAVLLSTVVMVVLGVLAATTGELKAQPAPPITTKR